MRGQGTHHVVNIGGVTPPVTNLLSKVRFEASYDVTENSSAWIMTRTSIAIS
jgi:hypothetical protein